MGNHKQDQREQGASEHTYEIELAENQPIEAKMSALRQGTPGVEYEVLDERDGKAKVKVTGDEQALRQFDERYHGG